MDYVLERGPAADRVANQETIRLKYRTLCKNKVFQNRKKKLLDDLGMRNNLCQLYILKRTR